MPASRRCRVLLGLTAASFVAANITGQTGMSMTSVTNAGFLWNTSTVMVPFAMWIMRGQRPSTQVVLIACITLTGAFLMSGGSLHALNTGDILCVVSAMFYSLWMVLLGDVLERTGNA